MLLVANVFVHLGLLISPNSLRFIVEWRSCSWHSWHEEFVLYMPHFVGLVVVLCLACILCNVQDGDDAASLPVKSCLLCGDRSAPLGARTLVSQVKNTMSMEVMQPEA